MPTWGCSPFCAVATVPMYLSIPLLLPALSNWYVMPSGTIQKEKALERDFISLNKAAVESGLTTASEQSRFRATHDIRRKPADSARAKSEKSIQFPPDMTFGISTRYVHMWEPCLVFAV